MEDNLSKSNDDKSTINNTENDTANSKENKTNKNDASDYECSICLDIAKEPVVSKCGHLFCWPCIYSWNLHKKTCPNCNNLLENEKDFIPIYNKNQNSNNTNRFKIPERPKGERNINDSSSSSSSDFSFGSGFDFNILNIFGLGLGLPFLGFSLNLGNTNRVNNQNGQGRFFSHNVQRTQLDLNIFEDPNLNSAFKCLIVILMYIVLSGSFL